MSSALRSKDRQKTHTVPHRPQLHISGGRARIMGAYPTDSMAAQPLLASPVDVLPVSPRPGDDVFEHEDEARVRLTSALAGLMAFSS